MAVLHAGARCIPHLALLKWLPHNTASARASQLPYITSSARASRLSQIIANARALQAREPSSRSPHRCIGLLHEGRSLSRPHKGRMILSQARESPLAQPWERSERLSRSIGLVSRTPLGLRTRGSLVPIALVIRIPSRIRDERVNHELFSYSVREESNDDTWSY